MNFHNLKNFVTIVEEGTITKAAKHLCVSQQSLSEQLRKLEHELGDVQLVERSQMITLTPAGKIFMDSAKKILDIYDDMIDTILSISNIERTKIVLAVPTTEIPPFLPGLLKEFSKQYPEYRIKIIKVQPSEAPKYAGDFDLYFTALPLNSTLTNIPISPDGSYAVAFTQGLAERVYGEQWTEVEKRLIQTKDITTLKEMPFIILTDIAEHPVLDREEIFKETGFTPKIAFQSENGELNSNMCILGEGVYVATMDYCQYYFKDNRNGNDEILIYPIETAIKTVGIFLSCRKGKRITKVDKCFIDTAKRYLQENYLQ